MVGNSNSVVVSHLQFADDTLLLCAKSWANVRALRAVLTLFAEMSGLKVNFNKSMLVGINIADSWLYEAASILNCKVGKVPFVYLGLSIGGDPRRIAFWGPVLKTIKTRLLGVAKPFSFLWRSIGPSEVCPDSVTCLCSFLLQGSVRYNLYH
jgi:hypothetical protein